MIDMKIRAMQMQIKKYREHGHVDNQLFDWKYYFHVFKYVVITILIGIVLYGEDIFKDEIGRKEEGRMRIAIAASVIITSYGFLENLSALPLVGSYTNMIAKVKYNADVYTNQYRKK